MVLVLLALCFVVVCLFRLLCRFELEKVRQKLMVKEERLRGMKDLQEALLAERAAERKKAIIEKHQFVVVLRVVLRVPRPEAWC